ncbi:MAG: HD domain-containing protein [Desulfoarculaceae bacterium]|nr:HD domain-containing protein [Desulfoarculaceae bacterium]
MNILSPSIRGFTYNRVIIALVAVMLVTLAVIDSAIIRQQRDSIMREVRERAAMEMEQAATSMTEPLLKYQFANIEQFIQRWAMGNHEVVNFTAITPSGHILTRFQRPITSPHRFTVEKNIALQERHLLTLVLEKDYSHAEALLSQLKTRLFLASIFISAALGTTLWFVFRFLAIRPLEQEVSRRRQAELALEEVNQQLEERVQARTREISALLNQEIRHREALTRLTAERTANYEETIFTFVDMIEQRDTYTAGHTGRVAEYCRLIAQAMGISESETTRLYQAAILHDIGKIATPDAVLLKPGKLAPLDRELIKLHASAGYHMLSGIAMYKDLTEIIHHHHERYDGEGYPDRLQGEDIPLLSRILTVADAFDAMTTNRIYKPRKDLTATLTELRLLGGKQFDPKVVAAAIPVLEGVQLPESISQTPITDMEKKRFSYFFNDRITGLYNEDYLKIVLQDNQEHYQYKCLNILHLQNVQEYNKRQGWAKGNLIFTQFAGELQKLFPDAKLFRAYGNDFAVISRETCSLESRNPDSFASLSGTGITIAVQHIDLATETQYTIDKLEKIELISER